MFRDAGQQGLWESDEHCVSLFRRATYRTGRRGVAEMLQHVGYDTLESLIDAAVPEGIRFREKLNLPSLKPSLKFFESFERLLKKRAGKILHRSRLSRVRHPP
jgi:glycine cleavage system pyridoxal-binding protein P